MKQKELQRENPKWFGALSETEWTGIFGPVILYGKGELQSSYRLDLEIQQKVLFDDFRKIRSNEEAVNWINTYGFPGLHPGGKNYVEQSLDTIVASASFLDRILSLRAALSQAVLDSRTDKLESLLVIDSQARIFQRLFFISEIFFSDDNEIVEEKFLHYFQTKNWEREKNKKEILISLAQETLARAGETLVRNIKIQFIWNLNSLGEFSMVPNYSVECPWEAICSELLRRISGTLKIRKMCPHPDCVRAIEEFRSHAKSCPDHKKWRSRHPEAIRYQII
ncbi:MAG: hypothetical protein KIT34_18840 [Cyanobacteria bacterium TGS_CYA1]|nr:hypothetical protein [Cyanobacteria bacterium TGS_CYA1]